MRVSNEWRKVDSTEDVANILSRLLLRQSKLDQDKENLWVLCLDNRQVVMSVHLVAVGILTETLVHPREVFRPAIIDGAASIIVGHNHPSGTPLPSDEDVSITSRLKGCGTILGIELKDHVIISRNGFESIMKGEDDGSSVR